MMYMCVCGVSGCVVCVCTLYACMGVTVCLLVHVSTNGYIFTRHMHICISATFHLIWKQVCICQGLTKPGGCLLSAGQLCGSNLQPTAVPDEASEWNPTEADPKVSGHVWHQPSSGWGDDTQDCQWVWLDNYGQIPVDSVLMFALLALRAFCGCNVWLVFLKIFSQKNSDVCHWFLLLLLLLGIKCSASIEL